jgi:cysteine desulfurase
MIFADYNSTTPLGAAAKTAILNACEIWGNPNSSHRLGREALKLLDVARGHVALAVGVTPHEVVFTSGGSEANTNALMGSYFATPQSFRLLTSRIEHSSIQGTVALLKSLGAVVEYAEFKASGELDVDALQRQIGEFKPTLVSLMAANNETGVVYPIAQVAGICKAAGVLFHTDAVQALGKVAAEDWNMADLISVSAHKIYGPKGAGALVVRNNVKLVSTHFGGSQEIKRRGGTQNMIGIAGFGGACSALPTPEQIAQVRALRDAFEEKLFAGAEDVFIFGRDLTRSPNTTNVRFAGIAAEVMLSALDIDGVCISAGSACTSGSILPSHVLTALGLPESHARECFRTSWGLPSQPADVDRVATLVLNHVHRIRSRKH